MSRNLKQERSLAGQVNYGIYNEPAIISKRTHRIGLVILTYIRGEKKDVYEKITE